MLKRFLIGLLLVLLSGPAPAQEFKFPELSGYKINTDFQVFNPDNLWDFINGAAETYLLTDLQICMLLNIKRAKMS